MLPAYWDLSLESSTVLLVSSHRAQVQKEKKKNNNNMYSAFWLEGGREFGVHILKHYISLLKTPLVKSTTWSQRGSNILYRRFSEASLLFKMLCLLYKMFILLFTAHYWCYFIPNTIKSLLWFLPDLPKQRLIHYAVINRPFWRAT